jgi:hypothetical protein
VYNNKNDVENVVFVAVDMKAELTLKHTVDGIPHP